MAALTVQPAAFDVGYLRKLRQAVLGSPHLRSDPLNRDFVGARGFAVVFRAGAKDRVLREFPAFARYLELALDPTCGAFYLNPLLVGAGGRVDPHIDRSLRSYVKTVPPPTRVSVLYVALPKQLRGGELVLRRGKRELARHRPSLGELVVFDGDLEHAVTQVDGEGERFSLVCEQYTLTDAELDGIPEYLVERGAASRYR
jgi:hypothetical protein